MTAIFASLSAHVKKRTSIRCSFFKESESGRDKMSRKLLKSRKKYSTGFSGKKAA
jgi:hypothetical protein